MSKVPINFFGASIQFHFRLIHYQVTVFRSYLSSIEFILFIICSIHTFLLALRRAIPKARQLHVRTYSMVAIRLDVVRTTSFVVAIIAT